MKNGEYGITYRLGVNFDVSGFTTLSLVFTKPDASTLTRTQASGVSVGTTSVSTPEGQFDANKYIEYVFASGEVDQAGAWTAQLTYTDTSLNLISDSASFTVESA